MNFLAPVSGELAALGIESTVILDGEARRFADERGLVFFARNDSADIDSLFDQVRFDLVIVGTSENSQSRAYACVAAARGSKVPSLGVVDLPVNAERRFSGTSESPLTFAPDTILAGDRETLEAFRNLGMPTERLVLIQNPRLALLAMDRVSQADRVAARVRRYPDWDRARPIVVFAAEPVSAIAPESSYRDETYVLHGRGIATWRTAIVLEELLDALCAYTVRPYVIVRLHPKNLRADFLSYEPEVDRFEQGGDPRDLLGVADVVVGMSSMLLQESAAMGVPTLSIVPRLAEVTLLPMAQRGKIEVVTDRVTIREALERMLAQSVAQEPLSLGESTLTISQFIADTIVQQRKDLRRMPS